ncbi:hypothetical protein [Microbulbifer aggregans]|uniref:hypothetical protein n=1 Tax=Microbulbifer aggregans TaxID=1769779 RepID=UPI001CFF3110|nr:hypothetical protein [Microbulbifer aggregans]
MKITLTKTQIKLIIFWAILIAIAPFALETLMLAELAGAEFAVGFLLLYLKQSIIIVREKVAGFLRFCGEVAEILSEHFAFREGHYLSHASLSLAVIAIGAPVFYAAIVWYPVLAVRSFT